MDVVVDRSWTLEKLHKVMRSWADFNQIRSGDGYPCAGHVGVFLGKKHAPELRRALRMLHPNVVIHPQITHVLNHLSNITNVCYDTIML